MKKFFYSLLSLILVVGIVFGGLQLWGADNIKPSNWGKETEQTEKDPEEDETPGIADENGDPMDPDKVYIMPTAMTISGEKLAAAIAAGKTIDVKISATVTPIDAANKKVDFSVDWGTAPTYGASPVTDYVTVTPDSDGSTTATVSCKAPFGSDTIIITVTTRDGGFTDTCTVTYVGKASEITITSPTLTPSQNDGRGDYYELGTGVTHTFTVNLTNAFGAVNQKNLSVQIGAQGQLYFAKYHRIAQGTLYEDITLKPVSTFADKFITSATISGTTLTVKAGSTVMENFFSSMSTSDSITYRYDKYVAAGSTATTSSEYATAVSYNQTNIDKCYFTVTVTDSESGKSATMKLWLVTGVKGVTMSQSTLAF